MPEKPKHTNLTSFISRKFSSLIYRLAPGWAHKKIDALLLNPKIKNKKPYQVPRVFTQFEIRTRDGRVHAYQTGKGPTVVFVHGWDGGANLFFPLMRGLSQCGFTALTFDQLGYGQSDEKPATIQQAIKTANYVVDNIRKKSADGLAAVVGHSTGCIAIASLRASLIKDTPLFLISPVFKYKLFFLNKLLKLQLPSELIKQYATQFSKAYESEYRKLELARNLGKYSDRTVIAHDQTDAESPVSESVKFCSSYPMTKLLVTKKYDHNRIINSESVWHELKAHLNYEDTTINFAENILNK